MADGVHITCLSAHQVAGAVCGYRSQSLPSGAFCKPHPSFCTAHPGNRFRSYREPGSGERFAPAVTSRSMAKHRQLVILSAADNVVHDLTADDRINDGESCQNVTRNNPRKQPLSIGLDKGNRTISLVS